MAYKGHDDVLKAKEIARATGANLTDVLKALREHPEPEPATRASSAPVHTSVTDHRKTRFWITVEDYQRQNKCKITDAIRYARKLDPEAFEEYLEVANS